jgi:hypothetical protein
VSLWCLVSLSAFAQVLAMHARATVATPTCRWVDETGLTQLAHVVTGKYKKVTTCTDSLRYGFFPEQSRVAGQRATEGRAAPPCEKSRIAKIERLKRTRTVRNSLQTYAPWSKDGGLSLTGSCLKSMSPCHAG